MNKTIKTAHLNLNPCSSHALGLGFALISQRIELSGNTDLAAVSVMGHQVADYPDTAM
ncbi:MAG: hypothetical protein P8O97_01375 [Gammaproteobacteria bacterium]|nr:hypothetical protein [Gammaproteobacteria bacterium]